MKVWDTAYIVVFKGADSFKKSDSFRAYKGSTFCEAVDIQVMQRMRCVKVCVGVIFFYMYALLHGYDVVSMPFLVFHFVVG